jgi:hypothetical protein
MVPPIHDTRLFSVAERHILFDYTCSGNWQRQYARFVQEQSFKGLAATPTPTDDQKPRKSAEDFDELSEIYQGAISTVFHATCNETGKEVVLKAYHKGRMDNRHIARLLREVQAQQSIQSKASPHVCELIDAFEDKDDYFLVLERCHGGDVFALQHENGGSLSEAFVCTVRLALTGFSSPVMGVPVDSYGQSRHARALHLCSGDNCAITKDTGTSARRIMDSPGHQAREHISD